MDKSLASKYFNIGLRKNDPIGFNPDTYERVKEYTGIYAPLLQSITTAGDLALRGITAAGLGTVGKLGDLTGQKQLSRDLAAMFLSAGGTMGSNLAFTKPMTGTSNVKKPEMITGSRVENLPKKTDLISKPGEEGLYYKAGEPAYMYADTATDVFPIVKTKPVTVKEFAYDVAKRSVKDIQKSKDRDPKFMQVFDDAGNYVGGVHEGGRQVKLPLTSYEKSAGEYNFAKFRNFLDETYELSDEIKQKFPGIEIDAAKNPILAKANVDSSVGYALSSTKKPFTDTAPINRLKTITLNMQPEQRKLFFKRLLNPDARREIMRVYPELTAVPLTALSTIATAAVIKKKD